MNLEQIKITDLFDKEGKAKKELRSYFDSDGDLLQYCLFLESYLDYPVDSDMVKMYYAEEYASETSGNYSAYTLFRRAN